MPSRSAAKALSTLDGRYPCDAIEMPPCSTGGGGVVLMATGRHDLLHRSPQLVQQSREWIALSADLEAHALGEVLVREDHAMEPHRVHQTDQRGGNGRQRIARA